MVDRDATKGGEVTVYGKGDEKVDIPLKSISQAMDVKLLAQILAKSEGKAIVSLFNIGTIQINGETAGPTAKGQGQAVAATARISDEELLVGLLERLPPPRLDSLNSMAIAAAAGHFPTHAAAAEFLDLSPRAFAYQYGVRNNGAKRRGRKPKTPRA